MTNNDGSGVLIILRAQITDSGAYSCEAINNQGREIYQHDAIVTVKTCPICIDRDPTTCKQRSDAGDCQYESVVAYCPVSCNTCSRLPPTLTTTTTTSTSTKIKTITPICIDSDPTACKRYLDAGDCQNESVAAYCPASCNTCTRLPPTLTTTTTTSTSTTIKTTTSTSTTTTTTSTSTTIKTTTSTSTTTTTTSTSTTIIFKLKLQF